MKLEDKAALITLVDVNAAGAGETCSAVRKAGGKCIFYKADVSKQILPAMIKAKKGS
jgi:hypothetical protein